jgi:hypothetical protein
MLLERDAAARTAAPAESFPAAALGRVGGRRRCSCQTTSVNFVYPLRAMQDFWKPQAPCFSHDAAASRAACDLSRLARAVLINAWT